MAEKSMLWTAPTTGDGAAAYTEDETTRLFRKLVGDAPNSEGVLYGVDNQLAVSGAASPLSVATGAAFVYGFFYWNTAVVSVVVPTPVVGTTGHRVVLRALYGATRTVRITLISSADGVPGIPGLTQTLGVQWEISLATLTITTGGVITLTDARAFCHFASKVATGNIDDNAVDDTKAGNRVPQFYRRQGGSATEWSNQGSNNYTPSAVRMQGGVKNVTILMSTYAANAVVTLPQALSYKPMIVLTAEGLGGTFADGDALTLYLSSITSTQFTINAKRRDNPATELSVDVAWLAIGPE